MHLLKIVLTVLISVTIATAASAIEPADSVIKNALADIERFEQQASGLTPQRASNARRILKLLNLSQERLNGSSNQSDPSWQAVNQRYDSLKGQLESLLDPAASASASPVPTQSAAPTRSVSSASSNSSGVPDLVSGQRVRVKKMVTDMTNILNDLVTTGPSTFQSPDEVTARQKRLKQFEEALTRYPQVNDPDVQAAQKAFNELKTAYSNEFQRSRQQLQQLGDVQTRLQTIEQNAQTYRAPDVLTPPFTAEQAKAWVQAASAARTVAEHNLKELAQIAPLAYLPQTRGTPQTGAAYDADDVKRLQNNAAAKLKAVEAGYQTMADDFNRRFESIRQELSTRWQEDPNTDKRWTFIGEGRKEEAFKVFEQHLAVAQSSRAIESALGRSTKSADDVITLVETAKADFLKKSEIALNTSRMPEPASKDKKMLAIAKEVVENPKYEFGQHGKIVLTTDSIVDRERKDSEIEIDDAEITLGGDLKMSGTETTWTYKWKEFKFAVPLKEPDSDTWYIWWITAKNFSSGGNNTPINKWVSGKATKGNPILKKNLP